MIVFDLSCAGGHRFEGWFGSSDDFRSQQSRGLITCPECGSSEVGKAVMAPAVGAKGNSRPGAAALQAQAPAEQAETRKAPITNGRLPPEVVSAMKKLAKVQEAALKDSKWVGSEFAEKSRAMHYGEEKTASIHGEASLKEAKELLDEGIAVSPLPFPVAPPEDLN